MSVLLFCNTFRRMGLARVLESGFSSIYIVLIFSVFFANFCGAFSVYKTKSSDDRSPMTHPDRRLRDLHMSHYSVKDMISDYLEEDDPSLDREGDVILQRLNSDSREDYPDVYVTDGASSRGVTLQEAESPLYSRLVKVILEEDVQQSPDVSILRQKRPTPGFFGLDNLDFTFKTLQNKESTPPPDSGEEVFAPSDRRPPARQPPPPVLNPTNRGPIFVDDGKANIGDLRRLLKDMLIKG